MRCLVKKNIGQCHYFFAQELGQKIMANAVIPCAWTAWTPNKEICLDNPGWISQNRIFRPITWQGRHFTLPHSRASAMWCILAPPAVSSLVLCCAFSLAARKEREGDSMRGRFLGWSQSPLALASDFQDGSANCESLRLELPRLER